MRGPALLALLAGPALAEPVPLDAPAFGRLVEGRTLTYGAEGVEPPRGVETYHAGRRVTWLEIATGLCEEGVWYGAGPPEAPQICFKYEGRAEPFCYLYSVEGNRVLSTNLDGTVPEVSWLDRDTDGIACEYLGF